MASPPTPSLPKPAFCAKLNWPTSPAFRLEWTRDGQPERRLVMLRAVRFEGRARDGRPVEVGVEAEEGQARVTIHVDRLGDRMFSGYLFDRLADRLAHPAHPPGSAEEAAAFQAFYGGVESRDRSAAAHASAGATSRSR